MDLSAKVTSLIDLGKRCIQYFNKYESRFLWMLFLLLSMTHIICLKKYGVDTPWMDEWEALQPGHLSFSLNIPWLFSAHNEHRIVFTKILSWLQLYIDGLNYKHTLYFSFLLYMGLIALICLKLLENAWQRVVFMLIAFSALSIENFTWGFQTQFHLFMLFFLGGLMTSPWVSSKRWWIAPAMATACIYSFSSGFVCAGVLTVSWLLEGIYSPKSRLLQTLRVLWVVCILGLWLSQFAPNPGHPPAVFPWRAEFWPYFSGILSSGLGYNLEAGVWPGLIVGFILAIGGLKYLADSRLLSKGDPRMRTQFICLTAGVACLVLISMSRAGFGVGQAKSSRYAVIGLMVLPFLLAILQQFITSRRVNPRMLTGALFVTLVVPIADSVNLPLMYRAFTQQKRASQECIEEYFRGNNKGDCPGYIANVSNRLNYAKSLNLRFTRSDQKSF